MSQHVATEQIAPANCTACCDARAVRPRGFTLVEFLVVFGISTLTMTLALPAIQEARQSSREVACLNHAKQLGLAMHNYHDTYTCFPPGWVSRRPAGEGHPSTGWSTFILPYNEQAALYSELNLRDSVYEPVQKGAQYEKLMINALKRPVVQFQCVEEPPGDTNPLRGGWGVSNFSGNYGSRPIPRWSELDFTPGQPAAVGNNNQVRPNGILFVNSHVRIFDITDGISNTLMLAERSVIGRAGIWPGPRSNFHESDVVSDGSFSSAINRSETGFSSRHRQGGVHSVFCDGAARFISSKIDSRPDSQGNGTLQKLTSRDDGEAIGEF